MKTLAFTLLAAVASYLLPNGQVITTDDAARQSWCQAKGGKLAHEVTVTTTNIVPADPVKIEQAAAAWDMAITAQAYGATNSTKLANLYVMEGWANAATNEVQRDGILRDASRMAEIENNLTRNLGDWRVALTPGWGQAQTNIVAETKWVPVQ
jgi:hypothetical protein